MKMVVAIVRDEFAAAMTEQLTKRGFGATKLASTGGFLKSGNSTFFIGVPAMQLDEIFAVIRETCPSTRSLKGDLTFAEGALKSSAVNQGPQRSGSTDVGGATCFVLSVDKLVKV